MRYFEHLGGLPELGNNSTCAEFTLQICISYFVYTIHGVGIHSMWSLVASGANHLSIPSLTREERTRENKINMGDLLAPTISTTTKNHTRAQKYELDKALGSCSLVAGRSHCLKYALGKNSVSVV